MVDCSHPVQIHGLCAICGADLTNLDEETYYAPSAPESVPLPGATSSSNLHHVLHTTPFLKVTAAEASRIAGENRTRLLRDRKLSLVVDLDQTVLHATIDPTVNDWLQDSSHPVYEHAKEVHRVALQDSPHVYFVKLRPGLAGFFERLSELFELHVYTMGSRSYAHAVVRLFDPDGRLFQDRVLSRDDNEVIENRKMLTRIFPTDDRMVVVIDDRADVWAGCLNLLQVHPYVFFIGTGDINNPFLRSSANLTIDAPEAELDNEAGVLQARIDQIINTLDAELVTIERVLKGIHGQFYSKYVVDSEELPDVKEILPRLKSQIMAGCRFVFSGVFSRHQPVEEQRLWQQCLEFGGGCDLEITEETTHLISVRDDTEKVFEAMEMGVPIVRPEWVTESIRLWERQEETLYLIKPRSASVRKRRLEVDELSEDSKRSRSLDRVDRDIDTLILLNREDLEAADRELAELENEEDDEGGEGDEDDDEEEEEDDDNEEDDADEDEDDDEDDDEEEEDYGNEKIVNDVDDEKVGSNGIGSSKGAARSTSPCSEVDEFSDTSDSMDSTLVDLEDGLFN